MSVHGKNAICKDQPIQNWYQLTPTDVYIHILTLDLKFEVIYIGTMQDMH